MDRLTPEARSRLMSHVKGKDTTPEMVVRRLVHGMGYRYRLHGRNLPGKPDLVFASRKKIVLVHGCFWHRHQGCSKASTPKTRMDFWQAKFDRNVARDVKTLRDLSDLGWEVLTVWECQTKAAEVLRERLATFLGPKKMPDR